METSRLRMLLVTAGMAMVLLTIAGVLVSSVTDDADATRRPLLKTLWAVVNEDGTLERAKGVTDSDRLGNGAYRITFNRDVSGCAYSATIDLSGLDEGHPGEVYVVRQVDSPTNPPTPRQVDVVTGTSGGTPNVDNQFQLIVHC